MDSRAVYFHVGRFGHPFFAEQLRAGPDEFPYVSAESGASAVAAPRRIALEDARLRWLRAGLERSAIRGLSWAGHVRRVALNRPPGCALIHSAQLLLRDAPLPYVVDFECVEAFCLYQRAALMRPWARRRLLA